MRITGGNLRGRRVRTPAGNGVRPTEERVREALFSMLAARVPGCRFLDLYAGSGAVGLEAWSRGAEAVVWVEQDSRVLPVLKRNIRELATACDATDGRPESACRVVACHALDFLRKGLARERFDVIFADPPYGVSRPGSGCAEGKDFACELLDAVAMGNAVSEDGIVVLEHRARKGPGRQEAPASGSRAGWELFSERSYGNARLSLFCRKLSCAGRSG